MAFSQRTPTPLRCSKRLASHGLAPSLASFVPWERNMPPASALLLRECLSSRAPVASLHLLLKPCRLQRLFVFPLCSRVRPAREAWASRSATTSTALSLPSSLRRPVLAHCSGMRGCSSRNMLRKRGMSKFRYVSQNVAVSADYHDAEYLLIVSGIRYSEMGLVMPSISESGSVAYSADIKR